MSHNEITEADDNVFIYDADQLSVVFALGCRLAAGTPSFTMPDGKDTIQLNVADKRHKLWLEFGGYRFALKDVDQPVKEFENAYFCTTTIGGLSIQFKVPGIYQFHLVNDCTLEHCVLAIQYGSP